ncbi:MAG: hypothetical protein A2Z47_07555 [Thermodesulfovibrio sp. RBG_19FT_COMBO_42_12]|nr:MAG: hypothetical protein A2Z47_07555 [Thermodesulfovibrio sp. RBG_19FT_COMBO_42_12]
MVRFKKYIEKDIRLEHVKNIDQLKTFGITPQYVPDTPDEFEEFEFTTDFGEQTVSIGVAILSGKIKRVMLVFLDPEDPDNVKALSKSQLEDFLKQKGEKLIQFFEYIIQ